jgi:hypothetical protein
MTREEYLLLAVEKFRPLFAQQKLTIPPVHVACGFPSKTPMKTLGECWHSDTTDDGTRHIYITPRHKNTTDALGTLVHELLHACLPDDAKHGPLFKEGMARIGLEPPAKSSGPGKELLDFIEEIVKEFGEWPNVTLKPKEKKAGEKKKSAFKLFCPRKRNGEKACVLTEKTKDGDYSVTVTRKMLKLAFPVCVCGAEMEMEPEDFELYKLGAD